MSFVLVIQALRRGLEIGRRGRQTPPVAGRNSERSDTGIRQVQLIN
jgi:hypothetical protein